MATTILYVTGKAKWARLNKPDAKFNTYTLDLYLEDDELARFTRSGAQNEVRSGEDGKFIKLRRPCVKLVKGEARQYGPPEVIDAKGQPVTCDIGNGSVVTCKLSIYDTVKGKGTRLEAVRVDELVEYIPVDTPEVMAADDIVPF